MSAFIKSTSIDLGIELHLFRLDVFKFMQQCTDSFDLIFAGPPYALMEIDQIPELIFQYKLLNPGGWFVLEHTPRNSYKNHTFFKTERNYGSTVFSIFIQPGA